METAAICERMRELGVIVQPTGDRQNVLKVKPRCASRGSPPTFFVDMLDHADHRLVTLSPCVASQSRWRLTNPASTTAPWPGT